LSPAAPTPATPSRALPLLALAALALFAATLWLDTRQNGFPYFYHPDEPDKVDQLITHKWNFHHPLLMLGTAETVKRLIHAPDKEQTLVVLGRWCSAAFAAGGVLWLALLAWRVRGWGAFWMAGLLLLTSHQVYELAHYFKEDTSLLFAMALAFLALHVHHRSPGWRSALFAGAACGLSFAAKYLGVVILIPAAVILVAAQRGKRTGGGQWAWFALGFLAIAAAVNFPVFTHLEVFTHSFGRETVLVEHGEKGYTGGQVPIFEYLHIFVADTTPAMWALMVVEVIAAWRRGDVFDRMMVVFPFAFMLLLSCSTKTNDRYFLPATALFCYLAGLGTVDLARLVSARWLPPVAGAVALAVNGLYLAPYMTSFAHDDRSEMLAWIRANIPADATIAGEDRADLPNPDREERLAVQPLLPQKVIEVKYAADLGSTPDAVAAKGISYIVISESDFGIFFRKAAKNHLTPAFQEKRDFYQALFDHYRPVWERPRGQSGIYLHPGLYIYRLTPRQDKI
jgi:hypothetical protein